MRNLETFVQSNKYWLLSLLLLIAAVVFIVINQIDYLSRFSVAIVALSLLGLSIVFAVWSFYRPPSVPFRWASMQLW